MHFYIKLPYYVIPFAVAVYGVKGQQPLVFSPCTEAFRIIRDGLLLNSRRYPRGTQNYSARAVMEVRRHGDHRAVNSARDLPVRAELDSLLPVLITREYGHRGNGPWCLANEAATALVRTICTDYWRSMHAAVRSEADSALARGFQPNRREAIRQFLLTYRIDPDDHLDTVYRLYTRRADALRASEK